MFKKIFDFGYNRTGRQAVGFYIAHFIVLILLAGIFGGLTMGGFEEGVMAGARTAVVYSVVLSFLVVAKKNDWGLTTVVLSLVSGILAMILGGFTGLIIPAYLTTRRRKTNRG